MGDSAAWQIGGAIVLSAVRELAAAKSSAIIELVRGDRNGHIELVHGEVTLARTGRLRESEAFNHLLLWGGDATLTPHLNPAPDSASMHQRADALIEAGLQFLEALDDLEPILGGPRSMFEPANRRLSGAATKLPAEVKRFAQLITPGAGLIDLIDVSPFRPLDTIKVCYRLCELGVLVKYEPKTTGVPVEIPEEEQTVRQARFDPDMLEEPTAKTTPVPAEPQAPKVVVSPSLAGLSPAPDPAAPKAVAPRKPAPPPVPAAQPAPTTGKRPRKDPTGEITGKRARKDPTGEATGRRPRVKTPPPKRPSRPEMLAIDSERSVRFARFAPEPAPSATDGFDAVDEAFFAAEAKLSVEEQVDRFEDLENTGSRYKISKKRLF
jgi:hypothetical protein